MQQRQPPVRMQLELSTDAGTLMGCVAVDGAEPRPFTGWIGLTGAIDAVLAAAAGQRDTDEAGGQS